MEVCWRTRCARCAENKVMGDPTVTAPTAVLGMGTIIALLAIAVTYWLLLQNKVRGEQGDNIPPPASQEM